MSQGRIQSFLRERGINLTENKEPLQSELFTFKAPHLCSHCQDELIRIEVQPDVIVCFDCGWRGVGPVGSPGYRLCGECGNSYKDDSFIRYSATLRHGFGEAVVSSQAGCPLYKHLFADHEGLGLLIDRLERLEWEKAKSLLTTGKFTFRASSFALEDNPTCNLRIMFGDELQLPGLKAWTTANDPASKFIDARPYEQDIDSPNAWEFARGCIKTCREKHARCRARLTDSADTQWRLESKALGVEVTNIQDVPTRLLRVRPGDGYDIKLVELSSLSDYEKEHVCSSGFVALSYCWGGPQSILLIKEQVRHLLDGFFISELPKTIQDAARTVQQLDLQYLWVDALCIFQDDEDDKVVEIARMASYYGNATLTICAAAASSADEGFLFYRKPAPFEVGPIRLPLVNIDGTHEGHVYLLKEAEAPPENTTTRGWTMQESLLSRRMLIYAQRQLYWCCANSTSGCGGDNIALTDKVFGSLESLVNNIHPIGSLLERPVANQWQYLLLNYTTRHLGFADDKLIAVSALVSHLWELCKERGQRSIYVGGMLIDTTDPVSWLNQFLWCTIDMSTSCRPTSYRAPSWSWAAVDGPIQPNVDGTGFIGVGSSWDDVAAIQDHFIELVHTSLPFGRVKAGHLTLRAKKQLLSDLAGLPDLVLVIAGTGRKATRPENRDRSKIIIMPDTEQDYKMISRAISTTGGSTENVFLLVLGSVALRTNYPGRLTVGLIIISSDSGDMARIGIFECWQKNSDTSFDRGIIFSNCSVSSERLV